jgi:hypothetical protein
MTELGLRRRQNSDRRSKECREDHDEAKKHKRMTKNKEILANVLTTTTTTSKLRPKSFWVSFKWGGSGGVDGARGRSRSLEVRRHNKQHPSSLQIIGRSRNNEQPSSTEDDAKEESDISDSDEKEPDVDDEDENDEKDDDASFDESILSLLSERESLDGSDYQRISKQGPQRLRRRFVVRNRMLARLSKVKSATFVNMLRRNELEARKLVQEKHRKSRYPRELEYMVPTPPHLFDPEHHDHNYDKDTDNDDRHYNTPKKTPLTTAEIESKIPVPSPSSRKPPKGLITCTMESPLGGFLVMEGYQGLPSYLLLVVYCFSAHAFYASVDATLNTGALFMKPYISYNTFDGITLVVCYFIIRATGYLWYFVDDDTYLSVKFDMHNRAQLGYWDARIMQFFQTHSRLASFLNLCSFYTIYAVVIYWYEGALRQLVFDPAQTWYMNAVEESRSLALGRGMNETALDELDECDVFETFIQESWRRALGGFICSGGGDYLYFTYPFQVLLCFLFALLQGYLGNDFITSAE